MSTAAFSQTIGTFQLLYVIRVSTPEHHTVAQDSKSFRSLSPPLIMGYGDGNVA